MSGFSRHSLLCACLLLLLATPVLYAFTATQQGNQLLIDGVPTPLTFAWGLKDPAMLPLYRSLGFNTVVIRVDSLGTEALTRASALADAAEKDHLFVLVELASGGWCAGLRVNITDPKYLDSVKYYLEEAFPRFQKCRNLVGWIISTVEDGNLVSDICPFNDFLLAKYGSLEKLNAAWSYSKPNGDDTSSYRSNIPNIKLLTEKTALSLCNQNPQVRRVVQDDIVEYQRGVSARDADFQQYLHTRYPTLNAVNTRWDFQFASWDKIHVDTILQREKLQPDSSPFSMLELGRYQSLAPTQVMEWWVQQVRARDKGHLIFAGAQRSYRNLVGLPPSINGVVTECFPGVAEADNEDHNPQAIDIARHGNRFIVLAGILARGVDAARYANYLYIAPLHGAAGIGVADWDVLKASPAHAQNTQRAMTDLWQRRLLARVPAPQVAIVYSPYAQGLSGMNRSLYGFASGIGYYNPGLLMLFLRNGTCYGQVDYLATSDLTRLPLAKYQTILLPAVFDLPEPSQDALLAFVENGGTVLGDLGVGTLQADSNMYYLPPRLQALFGVMSVPGLADVRLNLEPYRQHPLFPSLVPGLRSNGLAAGYTILHTAQAVPLPGTDLLCLAVANEGIHLPTPHPYRVLERKPTRGVFIVQHGKGFAIYAPFPLYQCWVPGNLLFEEFHRDLFGHGAMLALRKPIDFLPPLCGVAYYTDGSIALWTRDQTAPEAELANPLRRVFAGAYGWCAIGPDDTVMRYERAGYLTAQPLPVFVDPAAFTANITVVRADAQVMEFQINTADEDAAKPLGMRVHSGVYQIAPGSTHHLMLQQAHGWQDMVLQADADGRLQFTLPAARCRFYLTGTEAQVDIERRPPAEAEKDTGHADKEVTLDAVPDDTAAPQ